MSKTDFLIYLIGIILFVSGCSTPKKDTKRVKKSIISNADFENFMKKFHKHELPFVSGIDNSELKYLENYNSSSVDWTSVGGIPFGLAKHYLFNGKDTLISEKDGGYFQCYYRYQFPTNEKFKLLLYYRFSSLTSYQLRLASFDLRGSLLCDLGVGGEINTRGSMDIDFQREFRINKDLSIQIEELEIDNSQAFQTDSINRLFLHLNRKNIMYEITEKGKFVFKSEGLTKNVRYMYDEENNYYIKQ